MDFRDCDSSIILILRGGILMSIGNFPESLSQAVLVGIMLVGRLGVIARRTFWRGGNPSSEMLREVQTGNLDSRKRCLNRESIICIIIVIMISSSSSSSSSSIVYCCYHVYWYYYHY